MTERGAIVPAGLPLRLRIIRLAALLLLLPAGLIFVAFPFYRLTLPGDLGIVEDTRAALGAGTAARNLRAAAVDCISERSGSRSIRGIGMTEYAYVIDLAEGQDPAATAENPWAGRSYEEGMAEYNRRLKAQMDSLLDRSRAGTSNRVERRLAADRSGELPAVRILSASDEPRRIGLVWGWGELALRWISWLVSSLIFLGLGAGCLFAVRLSRRRRIARRA